MSNEIQKEVCEWIAAHMKDFQSNVTDNGVKLKHECGIVVEFVLDEDLKTDFTVLAPTSARWCALKAVFINDSQVTGDLAIKIVTAWFKLAEATQEIHDAGLKKAHEQIRSYVVQLTWEQS